MENRLQAARSARGWSQAALFHQLVKTAEDAGDHLPGWASIRQLISRWENGHASPDHYYTKLLCKVYGTSAVALGLASAGASGDPKFALQIGANLGQTIDTVTTLWEHDVERREFLRTSLFVGYGLTGGQGLLQTAGSPTNTSRLSGTVRVGMSDVEMLQDLAAAYRRSDNRSGGGAVREKLVRTLHHEVAPLLRRGRYDAATGKALVTVAAEMTQLAGWMAYDSGMHGLSQKYLTQGIALAREAGDEALAGEILAAMAHQATYLGQGQDAVQYAQAAAVSGHRSGQQHLVAEAAVLEAQGLAQLGASADVAATLSRAERELDKADRLSGPTYLAYLDEAYLSAKFGHVFRELGDGTHTVRFAERSLDMVPGFERGRVFNLTLLAQGQARLGDIDQSLTAGTEALRLSAEMQSTRVHHYLREVASLLAPHKAHPGVADFCKRVRYLRTPAATQVAGHATPARQ
ncbi:helix-turn-helix transcriptional regulator [Kribbella sp. CA-247076]|uniref:helix-turn-helix transcriptional regulator n=1 Tax=Kribbella sp. CA-247076 TaxID=3239941 RepID=UPI003D8E171F